MKSANRAQYAVVAQSVEHILGKDEVGSSNLLNSSIHNGTFFKSETLFMKGVLCNITGTCESADEPFLSMYGKLL